MSSFQDKHADSSLEDWLDRSGGLRAESGSRETQLWVG